MTKEIVLCKDCKHRPVEVGSCIEGPLKDNAKDDWAGMILVPFFVTTVTTQEFRQMTFIVHMEKRNNGRE